MRVDKRLIALLFTFLFVSSACAVHMHDGPRTRRGALRSAESPAQCKQRCKSHFHSCKADATGPGKGKGKGKGKGASHCAHQKNSCEKRCG